MLLLTFAGDFYALSDELKRQFKQQVVVASVTRIDPSLTRGINATVELLPGSVLARVTYPDSITQREVSEIRSSIDTIPVVVAVGDRVYVSDSSMVLVESRIIDANTGLEVGGSQIVRIEGGREDAVQTTSAGGTNHTGITDDGITDDGTADLQAGNTAGGSQQTTSLSSAAIYATMFLLVVVLVVLLVLQRRQKSHAHPVRYKMQQHPALSIHDGSVTIDQFDEDHWIHIPDSRTPHKGGMYIPSPAPSILFDPNEGRMVRFRSGGGGGGTTGTMLYSPDGRLCRAQTLDGALERGDVGRLPRVPRHPPRSRSAAAVPRMQSTAGSGSSGATLSHRHHTKSHPSTFATGLSTGAGTETDDHIARMEQHPAARSWNQRPGVNLGTQHTWGSDDDWGDTPVDHQVFQNQNASLSPVSPVDVNMTASPSPAYSEAGGGAGEYRSGSALDAVAHAGEYLSSHGPGEYLNLRSQSRTPGTQSPGPNLRDDAGFHPADQHLFPGPDGHQIPPTRADYLRNVASPQHTRRRHIQETMLQNSELLDNAIGDGEDC